MLANGASVHHGESGKTLPTGTVTFLFTDIQGSTPLWEQHPQEMAEALQIHNNALRDAIEANGGVVFKIVGDAFQAAFTTAPQALKAAIDGQHGLRLAQWNELGPLKVRMGLHTGEAELDPRGDEYAVSHAKNRIGRIHSVANGGQILLSQETADLVARSLPERVFLKDMGDHQLKGMQLSEHLFQVCAPGLPVDFPPLATTVTCPNNLPIQLTSFIGREQEINQVCRLLKEHRLVTLTGAGGVGKTRLALRTAEAILKQTPTAMVRFSQGIWLVELAPLGEGELIPRAIALVFGVHEEQNRSIYTVLLDYLREKEMLLLFDNCEHLLAECAEIIETILRSCPRVSILASSREALGVEGEQPFYVPSLSSPDPKNLRADQDLTAYQAIALFIERAQQALPGFLLSDKNAPSIAQICWRLDGIPLAIELAAARVKVLSPELIASRLDDRFRLLTGGSRRALPRHQTLQALIDWSYGLLTEPEQVLLRRLSVFSGGWTLEAVEMVCVDPRPEDFTAALSDEAILADYEGVKIILPVLGILDLLSQLVNKSLVVTDCEEGEVRRYHMLETVRQYAQEKLVVSNEAEALRDRHLAFFLQLAEECEQELRTLRIKTRLVQLDAEIDNLRMAFGWAFGGAKKTRIANGLRLASALGEYWLIRSKPAEGSDWLLRGLDTLPHESNWNEIRARACYTAGFLLYFINDFSRFAEARLLLEESTTLFQASSDRRGLALALCLLGVCQVAKYSLSVLVSAPRPEYQPARSQAAAGLAICRELGNASDLAFALYWNGVIAFYGGELNQARVFVEESQSLFEKEGNRIYLRIIMSSIGFLALVQGELESARRYIQKGLDLAYEMNDQMAKNMAFAYLGLIAYFERDYERMESDFQASLALSRDIGSLTFQMFSLRNIGISTLRRGQWHRAVRFFLENLAMADKTAGYDYDRQVFPMYMAGVAAGVGAYDHAAQLLGATGARFATFFIPLDRWDQIEFDRIAACVRAGLDENTFQSNYLAGQTLTLDQAILRGKSIADLFRD